MVFRCGKVEVDAKACEVRRNGIPVHLEPKVFEVLLYLIAHGDRVVSKQELFDAIWPVTAVGEAALTRCVYLARKALGDPDLIKSFPRRGYRFVGSPAETSSGTDVALSAAAAVSRVVAGENGRRTLLAALTDSRAVASAHHGGNSPPFVGRARELAAAEACLDLAVLGRGEVCLLCGEAGIGKTRFLLELADRASARGVLALRGGSLDVEGAPAYWPWLQLLRRLARVMEEEGTEVSAAVEQMVTALAADETAGGTSLGGNRLFLFERAAEVLDRVARKRPLAVLLDDVHRADLPSLNLFGFLSRALASSRVVLVGAYRPGDLARDSQRSEVLAPVLKSGSAIDLRGLLAEDIETLLLSRVDSQHVAEVGRALHAKTAGNPFLLTQLMPLIGRDGLSLPQGQLPRGVREVIRKRLEELGPECVELLDTASVFGLRFEADWLWFGQGKADGTLAALKVALGANLLRDVADAPGTFEFVHALIRDALYEELGSMRRAALHLDAAVLFETFAGLDEESRLYMLAHHHARALPLGDPDQALSYAIRAGTQAQARYAYEVASDHFARALEILDNHQVGDQKQHFAVLLDLGHALACAGQRDAARTALERAAQLARRLEQPDGLAQVALRIAATPLAFDTIADGNETRLLEEALDALGDEEPELTALLKARLAVALAGTKAWQEKLALFDDAEEVINNASSDHVAASLLCSRIAALWHPDNLSDRMAWADRALVPCARARDYGLTATLNIFRFALSLERGDIASARAATGALILAGEEYHQPAFFGEGYNAVLAFVDGRLAIAEKLCAPLLQCAERTKLHAPLQGFGALFSLIRIERGSADEVLGMLRLFGAEYNEMPSWKALLAYALTKAAEKDEATHEFDQLAAREFPIPRDPTWLGCMAMLAETCAALGRRHLGRLLYDRLAPYADRHATAGIGGVSLGSMQRFLGLLSGMYAEESVALAHFDAAIDSNTRAGARLALAYTQHDYSELLQRSRDRSNRARAMMLRESALLAARQCGARLLERRIENGRGRV